MSENKTRRKLKISIGKSGAILIAVFAALLALDLILKYCEEAYKWDFTVIPKFIEVSYGSRNTGAAFSFLADTEWGRVFFIVLTFIMLAAMIFGFLILPKRFVILKTALVMVASGALGNLVDRLAFAYVRDFVWMNIFGNWACCNFADFYIVLGVILAIVDVLFLDEWAVFPLTKKAKERVERKELAAAESAQIKEDSAPVQTDARPREEKAQEIAEAEQSPRTEADDEKGE